MSGSRLPLRTRGIAAVVLFGVLAASCTDSLTETQESNSRAAAVTSADEYYYYRGARIPLTAESDRLVVAMTDGAQVTDVNAALAADGYSVRTAIPMWQAPGHSIVALSSQRNPGLARAVEVLRAHPRVRFAAPVYRTPEGDEMQLLDVALVAPKPGVSIQDLHPVAAAAGTRILDAPMPDSGRTFYRFKYLPTIDPLAALARLNTDPLIDWAAPNMVSNRELASPPGDPYYSLQYYLKNPRMRNGVNVDIAAEQAWQITTGDPGLQIAVVDDGVEIDFTSGLDFTMSGVGYFDAVCPPSGCGGDSPVNPFGDDSHGTMVSGLILGEHNATGIAGIAPGIKRLYVVRIFYNGIAVDDQMIAIGLQMARYAGSAVINNSWGGGAPSDAITAAIDSATIRGRGGLGTVVVFSAGNSSRREHGIYGPVRYPGKLPNVIAVGAINKDGLPTDYTPRGPEVDIVAPSGHYTDYCIGDVVTFDLVGAWGCSDGPGGNSNYTSTFSGTSAAAPQVTAVAALVLSRFPGLTETQVRQRLYDRADPWGLSSDFGHGKLNAYRAIYDPPPPALSVSISGPETITTKATYSWEAMPMNGNGSYSYAWRKLDHESGWWSTLGTGKTQAMLVSAGSDFRLEVTVTSGGQTATANLEVRNCIGKTGCQPDF